jgi:uncharacterized protein (DUF486 family)
MRNRCLDQLLVVISSVFMTYAWYGHLRYQSAPIWKAIFVSWLIASLELGLS